MLKTIFAAIGLPLRAGQFWRSAALLWGGFAVVSYVVVTLGQWVLKQPMLLTSSLFWGLRWSLWLACTPLIVWLAYRFPVTGLRGARAVARTLAAHLLGSTTLVGGSMLVVYAVVAPLYRREAGLAFDYRHAANWALTSYDTFLAIYLLVVLGFSIVAYVQRNRRLEQENAAYRLRNAELQSQLSESQLRALRMQLNPHFLFNTHQSIVGLILQHDGKRAIDMLSALSDLLRSVVCDELQPLLPLRAELALTEKYLAIQQIRFRHKLHVVLEVAPAAAAALLPSFILQPLVENAVVHGIEGMVENACITLRAWVADGELRVQLHDNGRGAGRVSGSHGPAGTGVGLSNTQARLRQQYGDQASLRLEQLPARRARACICACPTRRQPTPNLPPHELPRPDCGRRRPLPPSGARLPGRRARRGRGRRSRHGP